MMNKIIILAALAISLAAAGTLVIAKVYQNGRKSERAAQLQESMELIKERSKTNVEFKNMGDPALCRSIGGEWVRDNCE